jgi:hypothetical protein
VLRGLIVPNVRLTPAKRFYLNLTKIPRTTKNPQTFNGYGSSSLSKTAMEVNLAKQALEFISYNIDIVC